MRQLLRFILEKLALFFPLAKCYNNNNNNNNIFWRIFKFTPFFGLNSHPFFARRPNEYMQIKFECVCLPHPPTPPDV